MKRGRSALHAPLPGTSPARDDPHGVRIARDEDAGRAHAARLEAVAAHWQALLPGSRPALRHLATRQIPAAAAARWRLGVADDDVDGLAARVAGIGDGDLARAREQLVGDGVLAHAGSRGYRVRFARRLIYPIPVPGGPILGFGARALRPARAKFLALTDPRVILYGPLPPGRVPIDDKSPRLLLVEGYLDVIRLDAAGLGPAAAVLGTGLGAAVLLRAATLSDTLVLCFDGDAAGQGAAVRAARLAVATLGDRTALRFASLPPGHDPDSFVRDEGAAAFEALLGGAIDATRLLVSALGADCDASIGGRARLASHLRPVVESCVGPARRSRLRLAAAESVGIDVLSSRVIPGWPET